MPWTPEPAEAQSPFEGRIESIALGECAVGVSATTGLVARKSKANISASPTECVYGNYVLSGEMSLLQADRANVAKAGDLILYHSHKEVYLTETPGVLTKSLGFCIPTTRFADVPGMEERCLNAVVPEARLIEPLASCLRTLAGNLRSATPEEIASVFEACVALLPVSLNCFSPEPMPHRGASRSMRAILTAVNDRLSEPELTPRLVAAEVGISTRQLHKQFARLGTSFGRYVMIERLERIRAELASSSGRRASISDHAFRWGFNDLSTFNRAFRKHFGVQPRSFRSESGTHW